MQSGEIGEDDADKRIRRNHKRTKGLIGQTKSLNDVLDGSRAALRTDAVEIREILNQGFTVMLRAWVVHVTTFTGSSWPAGATIGTIPGYVDAGSIFALYLCTVVIGVRLRTWQAEDEFHVQRSGNTEDGQIEPYLLYHVFEQY